ncbi:MAG: CotH kinase family protein [Lachnospiraceae bacterium]|nr:CotH kinase family protein [Lachnospiraceae bacterium]
MNTYKFSRVIGAMVIALFSALILSACSSGNNSDNSPKVETNNKITNDSSNANEKNDASEEILQESNDDSGDTAEGPESLAGVGGEAKADGQGPADVEVKTDGQDLTGGENESLYTEGMRDGDGSERACPIIINEVISSNSKYMEHKGKFCDMIEIANTSNETFDLSEFFLSDTLFEPAKGKLVGEIAPYSFEVFFCVGDECDPAEHELPFKISASGETVVLAGSTGSIIETVDVPQLQKNTSYARTEDGNFVVCADPTPGVANSEMTGDMIVGSLSVSPEDGTRSEGPVEITFTVPEGCDVFYTLDGSEPKTSSKKYTGDPIVLKKTTTVRTLTRLIFTPQKSEITTPQNSATDTPQDQDILRNPGSSINSGTTSVEKTRLQSFSFFIGEPNETLDDVCVGIGVGDLSRLNASPHSSTRYPASIAMYHEGVKVFDETCGMNANGNTSAVYDKKSYRIKFSRKFGESKLHYKLFDNLDIDSFDSFVLRGSSQDNEDVMLKDELVPEILRQGGIVDEVLTTSYRPVNLYLNGEYRGLYYIREHIDGPMIASHYGCDEEDVTVVEQCKEIKCGNAGKEWTELWDYVGSHDLTDPEAYAHVESLVSLESVADYYLVQIWLHNIDTDNLRVYKVGNDKWRYALYDLDLTLNDDGSSGPTFMLGRYNRGLYTFNALIFKLLKNPEFMELFLSRMQLLYTTILSEEKVLKIVDAFVERIDHDMERSCALWGPRDDSSGGVYYINYSTWKRRVEKFKSRFAGRTATVAAEFVKLKGVSDELVEKYLKDIIK